MGCAAVAVWKFAGMVMENPKQPVVGQSISFVPQEHTEFSTQLLPGLHPHEPLDWTLQ